LAGWHKDRELNKHGQRGGASRAHGRHEPVARPSVNTPKGTASPYDAAFDTLLAIAHQMLQDNADAHAMNFDVVAWLTTWIEQPVPALGGVTPASLMVTQGGGELVSDVLKSMASGAYR
jgi:hypothetical protein